eukprot:COSAG06_NODE_10671_length_1639_cov_1.889610_1_plen_41_part_10
MTNEAARYSATQARVGESSGIENPSHRQTPKRHRASGCLSK